MKRRYWSKSNPKPIPIGYKVDKSRKRFPPHLFDTKSGNDPIPTAMEEYYRRRRRYPTGITPIYENEERK